VWVVLAERLIINKSAEQITTFMLVLTTRRHLASYSDETLVSSLDEFYRNYELITSSILNKSQGLRT